MQSIGEQLEEARKRKGISLREAAEATKIRSDFLDNLEQNKFEFELPEIYKRGFIRNYARYLKLDPEKILTEYSAHLLKNSRQGKKGGQSFFGEQLDIDHPTQEDPAAQEPKAEPTLGRITSKPTSSSRRDSADSSAEDETDNIFYIKAGVIAVGVLAAVFVVFGLVKAVLSSDPVAPEPQPVPITENIEAPTLEAPILENLTLIASGNVYVIVEQRNDKKKLYNKTMSAGETIELQKVGPVDILFTAAQHLEIVNPAGEHLRPKGEGTAKITIP